MNRLLLGLFRYPSLALVGALLALCGYAQLATARAERAPIVVIMQATPALAEVAPTARPRRARTPAARYQASRR